MKNFEKVYADNEEMKQAIGEALAEGQTKEGEQDFYDYLDSMVSDYNEMSEFDKELAVLSFKGSYLNSTIEKQGDVYTHEFGAQLVYKDKKAFTADGSLTFEKKSVEKKKADAKNPVSAQDVSLITEKTIKKTNPATEMTVSWWNGADYDWTWLDITRVEGRSFESTDRYMEDNSMYLPMRAVCEWFGEDVAWDASARKAYVIRDGQKTDMTGKIIDSLTYIKIRDFEKLGYTVDYSYDSECKEHTVIIKKNN